MSECINQNPNCIKKVPNSTAKFCAVCGQSAVQARGLGGPSALNSTIYTPQPSGPGLSTQLKVGLMADLSARRSTREPATVQSSLLAAGGVIVGIGICMIFFDFMYGGNNDNILGGVLVALGSMVGLWFIAKKFSNYVVGAVAASQIVVPVSIFSSFLAKIERGEISLPILITGVALGLLWALPGMRSRPTLLAAAAGWTTTGIATLLIGSRFRESFYYGLELDLIDAFAREARVIIMALGIAQLVVGWNLDKKHWPNLATPFIAIGIYTAIAGAAGYLSSGDYGNAVSIILLIALSLGLIFIGGVANRRATTWIGTTFLAGGLLGLVISLLGDDPSVTEFALLALIVGAGVGFVGNKFANLVLTKYKIQ